MDGNKDLYMYLHVNKVTDDRKIEKWKLERG